MDSGSILSQFFSVLTPSVSAQTAVDEVQRIVDVLSAVLAVFDVLIIIAVACAFLFFFWGIATFIRSGNEGDKKLQEAKNKLFWGIIAIFVLTSVWGIVYFLGRVVIGGDPGSGSTEIPIFELPEGSEGSQGPVDWDWDDDWGDEEEDEGLGPEVKPPPGEVTTPPGEVTTPPGEVTTPPGEVTTPPGEATTPPGEDLCLTFPDLCQP